MAEVKLAERTKPTPEMRIFQNEFSHEQGIEYKRKQELQKSIKLTIDQMKKAVLGYGVALKLLTDQMSEMEKELSEIEKDPYYKNITTEFMREFKMDYNSIDWTPIQYKT